MLCPNCEKKMTSLPREKVIRVGRFIVHAKLARYSCASCGGESFTNADELARLEQNAAIAVLREAKDIEGPELKQIRNASE